MRGSRKAKRHRARRVVPGGAVGAPGAGSSRTLTEGALPKAPVSRQTKHAGRRSVVSVLVDVIPASLRLMLIAAGVLAAALAALSLRERHIRRRAERVALVDPLTGIPNRLAFEEGLTRAWKHAQRYGRPLGLLLMDLDGFKQVNDRAGHAAGDRLLSEVATKLTARMRDTDTLARFGGDEFVAICPETEGPALEGMVRSLRDFTSEALSLPVRLSIGAAQFKPDDTQPLDLLIRADEAMYRQKRARGADAKSHR